MKKFLEAIKATLIAVSLLAGSAMAQNPQSQHPVNLGWMKHTVPGMIGAANNTLQGQQPEGRKYAQPTRQRTQGLQPMPGGIGDTPQPHVEQYRGQGRKAWSGHGNVSSGYGVNYGDGNNFGVQSMGNDASVTGGNADVVIAPEIVNKIKFPQVAGGYNSATGQQVVVQQPAAAPKNTALRNELLSLGGKGLGAYIGSKNPTLNPDGTTTSNVGNGAFWGDIVGKSIACGLDKCF